MGDIWERPLFYLPQRKKIQIPPFVSFEYRYPKTSYGFSFFTVCDKRNILQRLEVMIPCSETWFYWFFKRLPIFQFSVALGTCSRNRLHNIGISSALKWSIAKVSLRWGTFLLLKQWFSTYSWVWLNLEFVLPASIYWTPGVCLAPSHEKAGFLTSRSGSKNSTLVVGVF